MYISSLDLRTRVAGVLGLFAAQTDSIASAMLLDGPQHGVLEIEADRPESNAAAATVTQHRAVAADHLSAFSQLLTIEGSHGPSLASLVRSNVETWARAWWVMSATTAHQAEYRASAMIVAELETGARRGITLLSGIPIQEGIRQASADRDRVPEAVPEDVPGYSWLARELLAECGDRSPASTYSHLSGVAHGELAYTSSLSDQPFGPPGSIAIVGLPIRNLATYCTSLFGVTSIGMSKLAREWGASTELVAQLKTSVADAGGVLGDIREFRDLDPV